MNWPDTLEIVDILCEQFPDEDPEKILFIDLMNLVLSLEGFEGKKENCNERILEAIQSLWIEESN